MARLDPAQMYKNDPLLLFVRDKWQLPVGGVVVVYGLLNSFILLGIPLFLGVPAHRQDYL